MGVMEATTMTTRFTLTLGAMLLLSGAALAQGPEGPQGGFGQGGPGGQGGGFPGGPGGGRGGFGGGPGGMMGNRAVTAASLSLRTLLTYLDLTDAQAVKIALAKEDAMESMRGPGGFGGQRGGPGGAGDQKAVGAINALLSAEQKTRLATLVKAVAALQKAGIRPEAAAKLKLSDEQIVKLVQGATKEDVLDETQTGIAASFAMPQGGPGGPGGFGGGRGGFPGGPGGQGGPGGPPPGEGGGN